MKQTEEQTILLIEDNPGDSRLMKEMLKEVNSFHYQLKIAETLKEGCALIKTQHFILVLLDLNLPDSTGKQTFDTLMKFAGNIPVVLVSGLQDEELSVSLIKEGAQDYILKQDLNSILLGKTIQYAVIRRETEEALRSSTDFNTLLLQTIPFGMDVVDENGNILFLSDKIKQRFGVESLGKKCWDLYRDDKKQCSKCPLYSGINIGETEKFVTNGVMGGKTFEIYHSGLSFNGQKAMLEVFVDITESKQAEEKILELNRDLDLRVKQRTAELQAANEELETFSYSVSHDLKTPLRHISGFIRLFLENKPKDLSNEQLGFLDVISSSASDMEKLIDGILDFSRLNSIGLHKTRIRSSEMVQKVITFFDPETQNRKITFHVEPLPEVNGDEDLIRQVWTNLISNAIKYTMKKAEAVIEIGSISTDTETTFFIKDNGAGYNMKYAKNLFGVFQRLHKTSEFEGVGVGLANMNRIVTRHGGHCRAEGEVDKGATFYFSLPK